MNPPASPDMPSLVLGAVAVAIGLPLGTAGAIRLGILGRWIRQAALATAGVTLLAAVLAGLAWHGGSESAVTWGPQLGGGQLILIDGLSTLLMPFLAVLQLATLAVTPRREFTPKAAARLLTSGGLTGMFFLTGHPLVILVLWGATAWPTWSATRQSPGGRPAARVYAAAMLVAFGCLAAGILLMLLDPPWVFGSGVLGDAGGWLVAVGVVIRKGIFPFHSWYPVLFSAGPLPTALMATMPQVASFAAIRLLVGHADGVTWELVVLSQLALVTAAAGAALATVQRSLRGLIGTLAMSQSAMVLAGLAGTLPMELSGALCMWISSGLALTGIGLVTWSLESRHGPIAIDSPQGLFRDAPELACWLLLFGLAGLGFPGTLSFVADDLIVSGSLDDQLHAGLLVIAAHVFSGIGLIRAWFHIFGGPGRITGTGHPAMPRERWAMRSLFCLLLILGLYPGPLVARLEQTAASLLGPDRSAAGSSPAERHPLPVSLAFDLSDRSLPPPD